MNTETYRVGLEKLTYRAGREEWRLSVRSTTPRFSPGADYYQVFASTTDEVLDARLIGLRCCPLRSDDLLDLDLVWAGRRAGEGGLGPAAPRRYAKALRIVPVEARGLSPDDVCTVLAEAREVQTRCPSSLQEIAESVSELLDGILDGASPAAVTALLEANIYE